MNVSFFGFTWFFGLVREELGVSVFDLIYRIVGNVWYLLVNDCFDSFASCSAWGFVFWFVKAEEGWNLPIVASLSHVLPFTSGLVWFRLGHHVDI